MKSPALKSQSAAPRARTEDKEPPRAFIPDWTITAILLIFGTTFLLQSFVVPSGSMESTILIGDHLIVDKLVYSPDGGLASKLLPYSDVKRGDIIVFRWPVDPRQNYVKRVIGVPGDRIRMQDKQVYLNGRKLEEPYKQQIADFGDPYRDNFPSHPSGRADIRAEEMLNNNVVNGELVVPPDNYFAMGDNRDNSLDSRYWGFVPRENIMGKPLIVYWSFDSPNGQMNSIFDVFSIPTKTRWDRMFKLIRAHPIN